MKRKPLRIENPFSTLPQRQPNLRQRILVVEGEEDIRRLNSEVLICSGYQVDTAENGTAAWNRLQIDNYDLLITAQHLPEVSGTELLRKLHDTSICLPVIMTTRIMPTWEFALHPWLQATTMLRMPYTIELLLEKVKHLLHLTTSRRHEIAPPPNWRFQSAAPDLVSA